MEAVPEELNERDAFAKQVLDTVGPTCKLIDAVAGKLATEGSEKISGDLTSFYKVVLTSTSVAHRLTPSDCSTAHSLLDSIGQLWTTFKKTDIGGAITSASSTLLAQSVEDRVGDSRFQTACEFLDADGVPVLQTEEEDGTNMFNIVCASATWDGRAANVVVESIEAAFEAIQTFGEKRIEALFQEDFSAYSAALAERMRTIDMALNVMYSDSITTIQDFEQSEGIEIPADSTSIATLDIKLQNVAPVVEAGFKAVQGIIDTTPGFAKFEKLNALLLSKFGRVPETWDALEEHVVQPIENNCAIRRHLFSVLRDLHHLVQIREPDSLQQAIETFKAASSETRGSTYIGCIIEVIGSHSKLEESFELNSLVLNHELHIETIEIVPNATRKDVVKTQTVEQIRECPADLAALDVFQGVSKVAKDCKEFAFNALYDAVFPHCLKVGGQTVGTDLLSHAEAVVDVNALERAGAIQSLGRWMVDRSTDGTTCFALWHLCDKLCASSLNHTVDFPTAKFFKYDLLEDAEDMHPTFNHMLSISHMLCQALEVGATITYIVKTFLGRPDLESVVDDLKLHQRLKDCFTFLTGTVKRLSVSVDAWDEKAHSVLPAWGTDDFRGWIAKVNVFQQSLTLASLSRVADSINDYATKLADMLPPVDLVANDEDFKPEMAQKSLLVPSKREAVSEGDFKLDDALEAFGQEWATYGTDAEASLALQAIKDASTVQLQSAHCVLVTAIVSAMFDPPTKKRNESIEFLLGCGSYVPQALRTAAMDATKEKLKRGGGGNAPPAKRSRDVD